MIWSLLSAFTFAAATDLSYPPTTSGGHDFNHAPVGQSFTALAANVRGGIYFADGTSFTAWLTTKYPGISPSPYAVAPSVDLRIDLRVGEGLNGTVLHSTTRTLTAPFIGFVDVDYAAAGVTLAVGQKYTIIATDVSAQSYPQGVTGWVVPAVTDPTPGAGQPVTNSSGAVVGYTPYGAYYGGLPVLQGSLGQNDAGIGDVSFQLIDSAPAPSRKELPLSIREILIEHRLHICVWFDNHNIRTKGDVIVPMRLHTDLLANLKVPAIHRKLNPREVLRAPVWRREIPEFSLFVQIHRQEFPHLLIAGQKACGDIQSRTMPLVLSPSQHRSPCILGRRL